MVRQLVAGGHDGPMSLVYSARRSREFALREELEQLADEKRMRLLLTVTGEEGDWPGERGRVGLAHLDAMLPGRAARLCYLCGPPALVEEVPGLLRTLGVGSAQIRFEEW